MATKLTEQEKTDRREARKVARRQAKEQAQIEAEKNQKPVKTITITIEWKKSRMWGSNPNAEAAVEFQDGTFGRFNGFTCSGCGYCKESTVIAEIFNHLLKYKLYQKHELKSTINREETNHPYGVYYFDGGTEEHPEDGYIRKPCYNGGVGTSCYPAISEFIGGKFENIASGKTFDVFKYTDLS